MSAGADTDRGSAERIRHAALVGFANEGVEATSIRKVAAAAGVSPGLVQHHFPSKAELKSAVDEYVINAFAGAFESIPEYTSTRDFFTESGNQISAFVRAEPLVMRYVARSIVDDEEQGLLLFDGILAIAETHIERLHREGSLREELDLMWMSLHLVIFNLACVIFEPALDRRLPAPFKTLPMMERWNRATTELYRQGVDNPDHGD